MGFLKHAVHTLYAFSTNGALSESTVLAGYVERTRGYSLSLALILRPFQPAKAIFAGIDILLAVRVFFSFYTQIFVTSSFIRQSRTLLLSTTLRCTRQPVRIPRKRLYIYTNVLPTPAMTKRMVELLQTLPRIGDQTNLAGTIERVHPRRCIASLMQSRERKL